MSNETIPEWQQEFLREYYKALQRKSANTMRGTDAAKERASKGGKAGGRGRGKKSGVS